MNERISIMDRFQMNRSGCRPYQYTCGMNSGMAGRTDQSFSDMAKQVPAMAYVPYQEFAPTFELKKALQEYKGSILLICHEPEFYQDIVTTVWNCQEWSLKL